MSRRRRPGATLAMMLAGSLLAVVPADAAEGPVSDIRAALAAGKTEKAARLAEKALVAPASDDAPAVRFLLLKSYVLDLAPGHGDLYKKTVGDAKDGMEKFAARIDELEDGVRGDGAGALPALLDALGHGDDLDRLLVLGLLADLAGSDAPIAWRDDTGSAGGSPIAAAASAARIAIDHCTSIEVSIGPRQAYAIEDMAKRQEYLQSVYAAEKALDFLGRVDPKEFGDVAGEALECRGTATAVLADRTRLDRAGGDLVPALRRRLDRSTREDVKVESLDLLGRYGDCADLPAVQFYADVDLPALKKAARSAAQEIAKRQRCAGASPAPTPGDPAAPPRAIGVP